MLLSISSSCSSVLARTLARNVDMRFETFPATFKSPPEENVSEITLVGIGTDSHRFPGETNP